MRNRRTRKGSSGDCEIPFNPSTLIWEDIRTLLLVVLGTPTSQLPPVNWFQQDGPAGKNVSITVPLATEMPCLQGDSVMLYRVVFKIH